MTSFTPYSALIGGAFIGLAATLLLLMNGRIAGISGIMNGLLNPSSGDTGWRAWFLVGLVGGGGLYLAFSTPAFELRSGFSVPLLAAAGFLVGFGTRMGNGCTSGHGVCGIARLSVRSLVATAIFISAGMLTVYVMRNI
ncbi:MAG: YeeE/YedE family protein [Pseudomonadales bacterium]